MPLEGSRAKSRRAKQHLDALDASVRAFLDSKPYRVRVESDLERGHYVVRVDNDPPPMPTDEWALLIGDCAHNMRSALDYITWECAYGRGDRQTMFPIFRDEKNFDAAARSMLRHLSPRMRTAIKAVQPYHAPDPTFTNLWVIHALDNADKHRLLTLTIGIQDAVDVTFTVPAYTTVAHQTDLFPNVLLVRDAVVAEIAITPPNPGVQVKAEFSPEISFGEGVGFGLRAYAVATLRGALANLDSLLDSFFEVLANDPDAPSAGLLGRRDACP